MRRAGRAGHESCVDKLGLRSGDHAARRALWRRCTRRVRLGVRDLGSVPPKHLIGGYAGAVSERQPPMYFRLGGGTIKGISKPGEIVWSRIYVEGGRLHADIGRAKVIDASAGRDRAPLAHHHATMAHHACRALRRVARSVDGEAQANHIQVAYGARRGRRQSSAGRQGRHVRRNGHRRQYLRYGARLAIERPRATAPLFRLAR